jgi:hypothetical protein
LVGQKGAGVPAKRSLIIPAAVAIVLATAIATTTQCGSRSPEAHSPSPSSTPAPISLSLPTTIHFGDSTSGGAYLAKPTSRAKVSVDRALSDQMTSSYQMPPTPGDASPMPAGRLQSVLADVTMPNDRYLGRPIRGLTCWVVVYTYSKPINASLGGPAGSTPVPVIVQHWVTIFDARTGAVVRGFYTK